MKILRTRAELLEFRRKLKSRSIGFVPTMGALHQGHLSLIRTARRESDCVIASIFVNPTQFGPREDLSKYPRPLKKDLQLLKSQGCHAVFAPESVGEVYRRSDETSLRARSSLSSILCGKFRPGHFDGVVTVVFKLLSWVRPNRLYLGEKDFQQVRVIEAMVKDLDLPVAIRACPTVREKDGLAMSSRNAYLEPKVRDKAARLYATLRTASSPTRAKAELKRLGFKVQYVEVWNADLNRKLPGPRGRWLAAVVLNNVRLIDNIWR